jgi:hypothetical protein
VTRPGRSSGCSVGERYDRTRESDVELLAVEPKAIAEARQLYPDLLAADLVDLGDRTWFHVLRWSRPDGETAAPGVSGGGGGCRGVGRVAGRCGSWRR